MNLIRELTACLVLPSLYVPVASHLFYLAPSTAFICMKCHILPSLPAPLSGFSTSILPVLFFPFLPFLEIDGEAFNVMGDWRSVTHFVKQHMNLTGKVILAHKSLLCKLNVMGGFDKGNGTEQSTVKTRGSHNDTTSRYRSKSSLETYSSETWSKE